MSVTDSSASSEFPNEMDGLYSLFEAKYPGIQKSTTAALLCSKLNADGSAKLRTTLTGCQLSSADINPIFTSCNAFHDISEEELLATYEEHVNGGRSWDDSGLNEDKALELFNGVHRTDSESALVSSIWVTTSNLARLAGFCRIKANEEQLLIGGGMLNNRQKSSDPLPDIPACASSKSDLVFIATKPGAKPIAAVVEAKAKTVSALDAHGVEVLFTDDALGGQILVDFAGSDAHYALPVRRTGYAIIVRIKDPNQRKTRNEAQKYIICKIPNGNRMLSFRKRSNRILFMKICFGFGRMSGIPESKHHIRTIGSSDDSSESESSESDSHSSNSSSDQSLPRKKSTDNSSSKSFSLYQPKFLISQTTLSQWITPSALQIPIISYSLKSLTDMQRDELDRFYNYLFEKENEEYE